MIDDLRQLDSLERDGIEAWLGDLLEGRHPVLVPADMDQPAEILGILFFQLRGETRALIQRVIVGFLQDFVNWSASRWRSPAALELIRAVPRVVFDEQRERAWNLLLRIAHDRRSFEEGGLNWHIAALQALLDLRYGFPVLEYRLDADFWRGQVAEGAYRRQYLTTILEGLARWSPDEAFDWLAARDFDEDLAVAIAYLLPTLLRLEGFWDAYQRALPRLDSALGTTIQNFRDLLDRRSVPEQLFRFVDRVHQVREEFKHTGVVEKEWVMFMSRSDMEETVMEGLYSIAGEEP